MFVLIHQVHREGTAKSTRKIVFVNKVEAFQYMYALREHETILLFKEDQRMEEDRRTVNERRNYV